MDGPLSDFWGKLERDPDRAEGRLTSWHPLIDHCADVAACAQALLRRSLLRRRLAHLADPGERSDLTDGQIARLGVLCALHDLGKFNQGFQNKGRPGKLPKCGHVQEFVTLAMQDSPKLWQTLRPEEFDGWVRGGMFGNLLMAAICHHGRPAANGGGTLEIWKPEQGLDPFAGMARLRQEALRWFPLALDPATPPLPDSPAFSHAFAGLVMLADWLGSDKERFPYTKPGDPDRFPWACEQAESLLRDIGLDPAPARAALGAAAVAFSSFAPVQTPNEMQRRVLDLPADAMGSLMVLESETGSGKTEAALGRYLRLFQAGQVDGLYFALPTRTAATQIHRRIHEAMVRLIPDKDQRPPVGLAVPGYIRVDDQTGRRLAGFQVLWNDKLDDKPGKRRNPRGWAVEHPKRYLAGAVVIGTIDQVLLSTLMVEHAHLRATALLRHLLVVDEVHASDAYMNRLLEEALRFHLSAGGHALLMSATLGSETRTRLFRCQPGIKVADPSLEVAQALSYPLISHAANGSSSPDEQVIGKAGNARDIMVELVAWQDDPDQIVAAALAEAEGGARVLVLRNTVRDCVATQEALLRQATGTRRALCFTCHGIEAPHHARFSPTDRRLLDDALEQRFGKDRDGGEISAGVGCVVVATQTVQQSLDIDADLLLTDLCPMDVLLQRLGRLWRHERLRPQGYKEHGPRARILVPDNDLGGMILPSGEVKGAHGYGKVYADLRIVALTWQVLSSHPRLRIPQDNRWLVEATTHPQALKDLVKARGGAAEKTPWEAHEMCCRGEVYGKRSLAKTFALDRGHPYPEKLFLDIEEAIRTRLGAGDRVARFPREIGGPFGEPVGELTLPAWMVDSQAPEDEEEAEVHEADSRRVRFSFAGREFIYDALGLRPAEAD